jgi:uncharacterized RmlC-like cupin family protein
MKNIISEIKADYGKQGLKQAAGIAAATIGYIAFITAISRKK